MGLDAAMTAAVRSATMSTTLTTGQEDRVYEVLADIETGCAEAVADNPDVSTDEVYWDMAQAIMLQEPDRFVVSEVARISGVSAP